MKSRYLLRQMLVLVVVGVSSINVVSAQDTDKQQVSTDMQVLHGNILSTITADDYSHFLHLSELQKFSNIDYSKLAVNYSENNNYRLNAQGAQSTLKAIYRNDGSLKHAKLVTVDSRLPMKIIRQLASAPYEGWVMTGNRTIVRNFNPELTKYEVTISNGEMQQTLRLDATGKQVRRFAFR